MGLVPLAVAGVFFGYMGQPISSAGVGTWAVDLSSDKTGAATIKRLQLFLTAGTFVCSLFPGVLYDLLGTYEITYIIFFAAICISGALVVRLYRSYNL